MSEGKVSPGQDFYPPPARVWNNMIDAGRAYADGAFNNPAPPATRPRKTDEIKLKNTSAANRRKGEILKISGKAIFAITDENIWLNGVTPTDDCRFGILKYPAEQNEVQTAQVSGVCLALVNVIDEEHEFAKPVSGAFVLDSDDSGPLEILYKPSGTGEIECVVRFMGAGGGGGEIMFFSIDAGPVCDPYDIEEPYLLASVVLYSGGCSKTPPGVEYGGKYKIYDRCNLFGAADSMAGANGWAAYMYPQDGYCEPKWYIFQSCAEPECP